MEQAKRTYHRDTEEGVPLSLLPPEPPATLPQAVRDRIPVLRQSYADQLKEVFFEGFVAETSRLNAALEQQTLELKNKYGVLKAQQIEDKARAVAEKLATRRSTYRQQRKATKDSRKREPKPTPTLQHRHRETPPNPPPKRDTTPPGARSSTARRGRRPAPYSRRDNRPRETLPRHQEKKTKTFYCDRDTPVPLLIGDSHAARIGNLTKASTPLNIIAIPGATTRDIITGIASNTIILPPATKVITMVGTNDLLNDRNLSATELQGRYGALARTAARNIEGAPTVQHFPPPSFPANDARFLLVKGLMRLGTLKPVEEAAFKQELLHQDQIHLKPEGYKSWLNLILGE